MDRKDRSELKNLRIPFTRGTWITLLVIVGVIFSAVVIGVIFGDNLAGFAYSDNGKELSIDIR
jgi:hypothetical protein